MSHEKYLFFQKMINLLKKLLKKKGKEKKEFFLHFQYANIQYAF